MIKRADKITNNRTGQVMLFLQTSADTNGNLLQIDCISPPWPVQYITYKLPAPIGRMMGYQPSYHSSAK